MSLVKKQDMLCFTSCSSKNVPRNVRKSKGSGSDQHRLPYMSSSPEGVETEAVEEVHCICHMWGTQAPHALSSQLRFHICHVYWQLTNYCFVSYIYLCVFVCTCIHTCICHGACSSQKATSGSQFSPYYMGSGNWTQALRFGGWHFYLQSHLPSFDKFLNFSMFLL